MSLICYNVQHCKNRAQTQIHIWFWPEAAAGYFIFDVYVVAAFLSLELGYMHTFSLNHPGDPFFQSGSRPRVWKPLLYNRRDAPLVLEDFWWRLTDSFMRILNSLIYRATKFPFFLTAQSCLPFLFTLSFFPPANHLVHIRTSPLRAWAPSLWRDGNKRLLQVCLKDSQGAEFWGNLGMSCFELKLLRGLICSRHKISLYPKGTFHCHFTKLLWLTYQFVANIKTILVKESCFKEALYCLIYCTASKFLFLILL